MYCTFTDSKLFRSLSHCCIIFNNIICNLNCSLFDIFFQKNKPLVHIFYNVCKRFFAYSNLTIFQIKQKKPQLFSRDYLIFLATIIKRWFQSFDLHSHCSTNSFVCNFLSSSVGFNPCNCFFPTRLCLLLSFPTFSRLSIPQLSLLPFLFLTPAVSAFFRPLQF